MRLISIQEACRRKFSRQKQVPQLELHAAGLCAHIGKLSPGCLPCFQPAPFRKNLICGAACNLDCVYCPTGPGKDPGKKERLQLIGELLRESFTPGYDPKAVSFSGGGEPLLYAQSMVSYMKVFREMESRSRTKPWYYLYTNGVLAGSEMLKRLKDLGLDEIRFHLGASDFSPKVYRNMKKAVALFSAVTVETPTWPPHREKLFQMLPLLEDLGVKHLNLVEVEITPFNFERIARALPQGEIYPCYPLLSKITQNLEVSH